jgi:hypothetical protein
VCERSAQQSQTTKTSSFYSIVREERCAVFFVFDTGKSRVSMHYCVLIPSKKESCDVDR